MRFRPALVPTLFVFAGLFILANLGLWQLRRHDEATERLARIEEALEAPLVDNDGITAPPEVLAWRQARLTGRFLDDGPYLITGRYEFGRPGFDVVRPLQVDDGPVVLVNRGWVPDEGWQEHLKTIDSGGENATVEGLLLPIEGDPEGEPIPPAGDRPERWVQGQMAAIAARVPGDMAPVYLTAGPRMEATDRKAREPLPVQGWIARPKHIDHMEYAITWFLIFGTLLTIWVVSGFRRGAKLAGDEGSR